MKFKILSFFFIAALAFHSNYGAMNKKEATETGTELRQSATTMRGLSSQAETAYARAQEILANMQRLLDHEQEKINTQRAGDTQ